MPALTAHLLQSSKSGSSSRCTNRLRSGRGNREVNAAFGGGIAGRDHNPAVRQPIFSKRSIQNQLIAACLCHLRRRSQLVKEENALATFGQEFWRYPLGLVSGDPRETTEIHRIELDRAHIEETYLAISSDLVHDLRFANAAGAPDMHRHTLADQRMQRFQQSGGYHRITFQDEEDG